MDLEGMLELHRLLEGNGALPPCMVVTKRPEWQFPPILMKAVTIQLGGGCQEYKWRHQVLPPQNGCSMMISWLPLLMANCP